MDLMGLFHDIEHAFQSLGDEINIDQRVIDDVKKKLHGAAGQMQKNGFADVQVATSAFGQCDTGNELGFHHSKAHQVIADTLKGVRNDLQRFHDGIVNAEKLVDQADTSSADDLTKKKIAVDFLVKTARNSEGDVRNHQSRNQNLGNGGVQG